MNEPGDYSDNYFVPFDYGYQMTRKSRMCIHLTHLLILAEHLMSLSATVTLSQLRENIQFVWEFDLKLIAVKTGHLLKQKTGPLFYHCLSSVVQHYTHIT